MSLIKQIPFESIYAITRGLDPRIIEEMRNFLTGKITKIPAGMEDEFTVELAEIVQDIGVSGFGFSGPELAGELLGMAEGGIIIGKALQAVEGIRSLVSGSEAQRARDKAREKIAEDMINNPDKFSRLPSGGATTISPAIEEFLRTGKRPTDETEEKAGEIFEDIDLEDPVRPPESVIRHRGRKLVSIDDPPTSVGTAEGTSIDPATGEPITEGPPISAVIATAGLAGLTGIAFIEAISRILRDRGIPEGKIGDIIKGIDDSTPKDEETDPSETPEEKAINQRLRQSMTFSRQKIPDKPFVLPDDTKSYNYVSLERFTNANNLYQDNLFNTSV